MLTVYSASAGSGKTYNLVFDYLACCFKKHRGTFLKLTNRSQYTCPSCIGYRHILAITFTNNAAAEMKERVVRQLNALAFAKTAEDLKQDDFNVLCEKIFGKKHGIPQEECFIFVNETSKALLHSILYDYACFSITTIDSFIQRIIRSSALYLNLSMNYAVQIRLNDFYRMAIEQYVCELPKNDTQFDVVVKELLWQLEDQGYANINRFLAKGLDIIYGNAEKSHLHLAHFQEEKDLLLLVESWKKQQNSVLESCKELVKPLAEKALSVFQNAKSDDFRANQNTNWDKWFASVANDPFNLLKGFENSKCLKDMNEKSVLTDNLKPKKAEVQIRKDKKTEYILQLKGIFEQIREIVLKNANSFFTYRTLSQNANYLLVLKALQDYIEKIKVQTNSFFLSESNPLLFDEIMSNSGDTLFEKMGQYRHFFIDEFQDTSQMQWDDLKPLIINAMGDAGSLTLFGDVKQSIYRFRNGDAALFYHLSDYERLKDSEDTDLAALLSNKDDFHFIPLQTNHRSQSSIVDFNNLFFNFYANSLQQDDYYKDVEQDSRPDKQGGLVQIYAYEKGKYKDLRKIWPDCGETFYQDTYLKMPIAEAELLYAVMEAKSRGYAFGDITVLLSGRTKCNDFARCLLRADIPVVTSESLQLCDNPNINVIISTLRILVCPSDILSQTVILQYFAQKQKKDLNTILYKNNGRNFIDLLGEFFDIQDFTKKMKLWQRNPFLIAIKDIVHFYDFHHHADPFIADFIDLVFQYTQSQIVSIANFLTWWDDLNRHSDTIPRLSLEGVSDAVCLMTIHASKGLQFPVVITQCTTASSHSTFYWVTDKHSGQSCYVKHQKELEYSDFQQEYEEEKTKKDLDSLNLWYVDFTRAVDMLYILSDFSSDNSENKDNEEQKTNVKKILQQFVTDQNLEKTGDSIFCFGDSDWKNPKNKQDLNVPKSAFQVTCSDLTFCGNPSVKVLQTETGTEFTETGTHIHDFLQKLTQFPSSKEEMDTVVAGEPENIRERLCQLFEKIVADATLRPYFYPDEGDRVLNEAPIVTETGEVKRPDRIIFKPDHVMIIDYKTGREYKDKYEKQLAEYQRYLSQMGYQDVRTKILYID